MLTCSVMHHYKLFDVYFPPSCVKLTPVFGPCSQIITLSTQSVMHSGHDGEWQFPTKPTYAQASQIQLKALSAVSILLLNLIVYISYTPSICATALICKYLIVTTLNPLELFFVRFSTSHDTFPMWPLSLFQPSLVVKGSSSTCSRSNARSVR